MMRRPYYRKPKLNPTIPIQQSSLPALRERILNVMLLGTTLVGAVALIVNLISDIPQGDWGVISLYTIAYLILLFLTFAKKLQYKVRAIGFEVTLYALGVTATLTDGIAGNGRIWFLGFIVLSGILLSLNSGIHALLLSSITYLVLGGLMAGGIIRVPQASAIPSSGIFLDWISSGVVYVLVAITIIITLSIVIRYLDTSLEKEHGLLDELGKEREELNRRTGELDRRLVQIRTAAEISRSISAVLESSVLLQQVVDVVRQRFDLYYVGVFLLDDREENAVLRAGSGEAGQQMVSKGHKLSVGGSSMIGWTVAHRQSRISLDTGEEAVRFNNPLLPKTRSEMALPLMSGDQVFGAISVQSSKPSAFDEDDVTVLQGIADSLATALQNARLFQQKETNLEEIRSLNRQYLQDAWTEIAANAELSGYSYADDQVVESKESSSTVNVPISLRDQVIGQVSLELASPDLSPDDRVFIEQVTNQTALALENVRLLEETQHRAAHERLVTEIVKKARASADVDAIIRTTLGELGKSMQAVEGIIHLGIPEKMSVSRPDRSDL